MTELQSLKSIHTPNISKERITSLSPRAASAKNLVLAFQTSAKQESVENFLPTL